MLHRLSILARESSPLHADAATNRRALAEVPRAISSGADLLRFASLVDRLRGWGRGLRSAVGAWYLDRPVRHPRLRLRRPEPA